MPDIVFIILGTICILAGIIGCILPILPGPPLSYAGLLLLQFSSKQPFSSEFLIILGILTVLIMLLEHIIPAVGAKVFSGTKYGIWGCTIGLIIGFFIFSLFGMLIGSMVGALLGEIAGGKRLKEAINASIGSLLGFITGTVIKLILSIIMAYYFLIHVI